ncbi:MAG: response regulator [Methanocalculus sp.]|uniref:response regulator n=1 Tax=Methanocalculus sp. TaxID=2004547 RepID=UPI002715D91B|nr:response regulator [Methanocalculus sp.]MDO9539104.1 response regulator [Methanocalculus sp.]
MKEVDEMERKGHILVVEDSTTQAEFLRRILDGEGYRVSTAPDGMIALQQIAGERPDLVMTDVVMPGMNGYDLCKKVKEIAPIPVVLVTQLFDPEDVVRGVACGADNFIIKPFEPAFILKRVQEIFLKRDRELQGNDLSITISDHTYQINAKRETILDILLSTYAIAVKKNADLSEARDELYGLNEQLNEKNEALKSEILERERVESALYEAHRKLNLVTSITRHGLLNQFGAIHEALEYTERIIGGDTASAKESLKIAITGLERAIQTTRFTQEYQKIGEKTPVWERLINLIPSSDEYQIRIHADIPGDLSIYLDPLGEEAIKAIIGDAVRRRAETVTITYEKMKDSSVIIVEDDGIGIPEAGKEALFSYESIPGRGFSLFLAREALAITKITLNETGDPRQGGHFEIHCPAQVIQRTSG